MNVTDWLTISTSDQGTAGKKSSTSNTLSLTMHHYSKSTAFITCIIITKGAEEQQNIKRSEQRYVGREREIFGNKASY